MGGRVIHSIIKPLRPGAGLGWRGPLDLGGPLVTGGYDAELWMYSDGKVVFSVISAVEVATDKDGKSNGPEYHVSIARQTPSGPARCSSVDAAWVLEQFRLEGSEEDNHVEHGVVRNFWRPVAEPLIGRECECKASEPRVIEDRGDFVSRPA